MLALRSKKYTPDTVIDTNPGWIRVGKNIVRDHENVHVLTLTEIIKKSSNVGIAKIMLTLSPNDFWQVLKNAGFGEMTEIAFPGEQSGALVHHNPWGQFVYATMTIGYGLSVTTLQLARGLWNFGSSGEKVAGDFAAPGSCP